MDEFTLIRTLFAAPAAAGGDVLLGIGDDAALLQPPPDEVLAVTTDTLIAGRHFAVDAEPADVGWKALAVNLSDLAAMAARPRWFTLALTLPQIDLPWLRGFVSGLRAAAARYRIVLVGGDTTRGPLAVTITALGSVAAAGALRRDAARAGDVICVTGTLGDAALALRRQQAGAAPTAHDAALSQRLHRPTPQLQAGLALAGSGAAAIDLSDGLAGDLNHILIASGCGAELDASALPRSLAFATLAPPTEAAALQLHGGDDYELCLCLPAVDVAAARQRLVALGVTLSAVGRVTAAPGLWLLDDGRREALAPRGYDHFDGLAA